MDNNDFIEREGVLYVGNEKNAEVYILHLPAMQPPEVRDVPGLERTEFPRYDWNIPTAIEHLGKCRQGDTVASTMHPNVRGFVVDGKNVFYYLTSHAQVFMRHATYARLVLTEATRPEFDAAVKPQSRNWQIDAGFIGAAHYPPVPDPPPIALELRVVAGRPQLFRDGEPFELPWNYR